MSERSESKGSPSNQPNKQGVTNIRKEGGHFRLATACRVVSPGRASDLVIPLSRTSLQMNTDSLRNIRHT
jgi:hypothetical protein